MVVFGDSCIGTIVVTSVNGSLSIEFNMGIVFSGSVYSSIILSSLDEDVFA
mgnify:CR=1 FL=1